MRRTAADYDDPIRQAAVESDALFRAMADDAPVMLWMASPDGQCTFVNRRWLTFTGRTIDQEIGSGWMEAIHGEDREGCRRRVHEALRTRKPFTLEYRLRRADGQYRWVLDAGSPRFDANGVLIGFVGSTLDITEHKEHSVEVAEAEGRFRRLIENAHDLVYRHRVFPTRSVEYVGGAVEDITGHTAAEFYADPD